jgi:hypothetical protein
MTLSLQLNVYFNPLKLCDMLYIRKTIFIRKFENNVILFKQKKCTQSSLKFSPLLYGQMHIYETARARAVYLMYKSQFMQSHEYLKMYVKMLITC